MSETNRRSLTRRQFIARSAAVGLGVTGLGVTLSPGLRIPPARGQAPPEDPSETGLWEGPLATTVVVIHAALLPTWELLIYSSASNARVFSWWDGTFRPVPVPGNPNIFCSGHSLLSDGTVLVTGGAIGNGRGRPDAHLFDPFTATWTRQPDMAMARWYPSNVTLSDGQVLVVSGRDENALNANVPEIYTPGSGWTGLPSAQLNLPTYPYLFVLPDGGVLYAGPGNPSRTLDLSTGAWRVVGNSPIGGGSAVLYEPTKVMKSGGGDPAIPRTTVLDMEQGSPAWREVAPMAFPRRRHNLTVLPDGSVLVTGGTRVANDEAEAVYAAEIWSPAGEAWTTMASMQVARMYHSIALLLPDARVLTAGGNGKFTAEIYSPPYLFRGPRPEIVGAPDTISYASAFEVSSADAPDVAAVALVRPSAVTHAFNQDQRYVRLEFQAGEGVLTVQAPPSPTIAPPGYYMLFLVNRNGVPSGAWFVRL